MIAAPLFITTTPGTNRTVCEPVSMGMPFPAGAVTDDRHLALTDPEGKPMPLQTEVTERWPDGSIRWALLDFIVAAGPEPDRKLTVRVDPAAARPAPSTLRVTETARHVTVDTGTALFEVKTGPAFPFASVQVNGAPALGRDGSAFVVTTPEGKTLESRVTRVVVEQSGPVRAVIRIEGTVGARRRSTLTLTGRVHFFAGSSAVRLAVTLRNIKRAVHPGGIWELGDPGSIYLRDVSLQVMLPGRAVRADLAPELDAALQTWSVPVEVYQDSSGGEHWQNAAHVDRHGDIPCTFRGYRVDADDRRAAGLRATPLLVARHSEGLAGIAVEHFWQNWPKAISLDEHTLIWRIFPGHTANEHELQGGEQKTHRCTLIFGDDPCARDAQTWGRAPAFARLSAEWYCDTRAAGPAACASAEPYQQLVDAAIEGTDSLLQKRERADEYGWRHFGDIYADHENAYSNLDTPVVSHYNNQYDAIAGFAMQFMRSGDPRWHAMMNELAWHVVDIDIYHTDRDKSAYNHGLFWHTAHYVSAGRASHRSFPRHPRVAGGGPGNEHNYTAGLRWHWLLTGDPQSRQAVIDLATWVMDMDDGHRNVLRVLSTRNTGLASQTYSPSYHGPGRGSAYSILALLDGHRLTHDEIYLAKADQLLHRCIHPRDDIDSLQLLDAERRWSYTVFLQALGRFLDYRAELGRLDEHYAYGRAALLHYARWMVAHERPYLDEPGILEYPTETWPAQDMRKCEVMLYAAGHAPQEERSAFLQCAARFFDYSVTTLLDSPTRTLARPTVLMLSNGYLYLTKHAAEPRPEPPSIDDFGAPTVFVPQKVEARQRIAIVCGGAVVAITMTLLAAMM